MKPTVRELLDRYIYDPATGDIRYRVKVHGMEAGELAGSLNVAGYRMMKFKGVNLLAHRVAWAMHYGEWPPEDMQIDHRNGVRHDNRLDNLRLATQSQNQANKRRHRNNQSGFKGVTYNPKTELWRASIRHNGRVYHFDNFLTPEDAHEVYTMAATDIRGEFARHA